MTHAYTDTETQAAQSIEITLSCPPEIKDFLEEILWTIDGIATIMEEYDNPNQAQTTLTDLKGVKVFSQDATLPDRIEFTLKQFDELNACQIINIQTLAEADWATEWQKYWNVTHISATLSIAPTWKEYTAKNDTEIVIELDPGCAFGTGTHGTTQLMLKQLETMADQQNFSQLSFLDVGTGSGILAIYTAKRGATNIRGVEIDKKALAQAKENSKLNQVAHNIDFTDSALEDLCMTQYSVVLANIISPIIKELWEDMIARLEAGGTILLSGLVEKNLPEIIALIEQSGLLLTDQKQEGEWFLLVAEKVAEKTQ